jgi:hypothetical protein
MAEFPKIITPNNDRVRAGNRSQYTWAWQAIEKLRAEWERVSHPPIISLPTPPPVFPDNYDRTHLISICKYGDLQALQELIAQDFDVHRDEDYALQLSANRGHLELVRLLVDHGADIHAQDDAALQLASQRGHIETVRFLIDRGADINADNDLALRWAMADKHFAVADLLVEQGALIEKLTTEHSQIYGVYQQEQLTARKQAVHAEQTLADIFKAATWAGHVPEMKALWSQVPPALQSELDFSHVLAETNIHTLKQRKPKVKFTK